MKTVKHKLECYAKMPRSDKRLVELTEAELQFLVNRFAKDINTAQLRVTQLKRVCARLHELSEPDGSAQEEFEDLNTSKDFLRSWKDMNKKLSNIQTKLKRAR